MNAISTTLARLLAVPVLGLAAAPAFAITDIWDSDALYFANPQFSYCDQSPGAAPNDGVVHYDSATAQAPCRLWGAGSPGLSATFDVLYGAGAPPAVSGIGGALYHITFTNFTLTNVSGQAGDFVVRFTVNSPGSFPAGVTKTNGVILAGDAIDNAGDGAVNIDFIAGGGIDTAGAGVSMSLTAAGATPTGTLAFFSSKLSAATFGINGNSLTASLYVTAPAGDGFHMPGSFDLVVLGPGYTWNPTPTAVPLPAGGLLLGTAVAALAARRRRSAAS